MVVYDRRKVVYSIVANEQTDLHGYPLLLIKLYYFYQDTMLTRHKIGEKTDGHTSIYPGLFIPPVFKP